MHHDRRQRLGADVGSCAPARSSGRRALPGDRRCPLSPRGSQRPRRRRGSRAGLPSRAGRAGCVGRRPRPGGTLRAAAGARRPAPLAKSTPPSVARGTAPSANQPATGEHDLLPVEPHPGEVADQLDHGQNRDRVAHAEGPDQDRQQDHRAAEPGDCRESARHERGERQDERSHERARRKVHGDHRGTAGSQRPTPWRPGRCGGAGPRSTIGITPWSRRDQPARGARLDPSPFPHRTQRDLGEVVGHAASVLEPADERAVVGNVLRQNDVPCLASIRVPGRRPRLFGRACPRRSRHSAKMLARVARAEAQRTGSRAGGAARGRGRGGRRTRRARARGSSRCRRSPGARRRRE